jgi:choline dehydrogenase-like flavoprotein
MLCPMVHDVVVVGGGSAGCVLATRLSEDRARNVLLIEAGPDYRTLERTPADLLNALEVCYNPAYDWGFFSEPDEAGRSIRLWRARLMGGCSAINAAMALRGSPADYDAWAFEGNPGCSAAAVVNARGHGVDGLIVADASVMPDVPAANTNLPVIMVAERLARSIAAGS